MLKSFFSVSLAVVASMLLGELLVRAVITSPLVQVFDPVLGYTYKPGSHLMLAAEGGRYIRVNSMGLLDNELNPDASQKVVVLGDSVAESKQVSVDQMFHSLIEAHEADWDVVNAGFASFNPSHYPLVLERVSKTFSPDLVVLFLHTGEILGLLSPVTKKIQDEDGIIVDIVPKISSDDRIKQLLEPLLQRSALVTHLLRKLKPVVEDFREKIRGDNVSHSAQALKLSSVNSESVEEKISRRGQERISLIMEKLKNLSSAPVVVLHYDTLTFGPGREVVSATTLGEAAVFSAAAESLDVPFLDITQALADSYVETGQPPLGFFNNRPGVGHLNNLGHQVVARELHRFIEEHLPMPSSPVSDLY